jgi:hypothetical protein
VLLALAAVLFFGPSLLGASPKGRLPNSHPSRNKTPHFRGKTIDANEKDEEFLASGAPTWERGCTRKLPKNNNIILIMRSYTPTH